MDLKMALGQAMREYAEFCKEVFGLADWQVVLPTGLSSYITITSP
jgi:hypothetical protein